MSRSVKTLEIRKREIANKLEDIENAYPLGDAPKSVMREYDDLYSMYRETCDELDAMKEQAQ